MPCVARARFADRSCRSNGQRGVLAGGEVGVARQRQRGAQLIDALLVAEGRVLVEPFRHQHFRRRALVLLAVLEGDARAHESLRRLGERDDPEAERQPEPHLALEKEISFIENRISRMVKASDCRELSSTPRT